MRFRLSTLTRATLALAFPLALAAPQTQAHAQDRLRTMPGWDRYESMRNDIQQSVRSGALPFVIHLHGRRLSAIQYIEYNSLYARPFFRGMDRSDDGSGKAATGPTGMKKLTDYELYRDAQAHADSKALWRPPTMSTERPWKAWKSTTSQVWPQRSGGRPANTSSGRVA